MSTGFHDTRKGGIFSFGREEIGSVATLITPDMNEIPKKSKFNKKSLSIKKKKAVLPPPSTTTTHPIRAGVKIDKEYGMLTATRAETGILGKTLTGLDSKQYNKRSLNIKEPKSIFNPVIISREDRMKGKSESVKSKLEDTLKKSIDLGAYIQIAESILKLPQLVNNAPERNWWSQRLFRLQQHKLRETVLQSQGRDLTNVSTEQTDEVKREIENRLLSGNWLQLLAAAPAPAPAAPPAGVAAITSAVAGIPAAATPAAATPPAALVWGELYDKFYDRMKAGYDDKKRIIPWIKNYIIGQTLLAQDLNAWQDDVSVENLRTAITQITKLPSDKISKLLLIIEDELKAHHTPAGAKPSPVTTYSKPIQNLLIEIEAREADLAVLKPSRVARPGKGKSPDELAAKGDTAGLKGYLLSLKKQIGVLEKARAPSAQSAQSVSKSKSKSKSGKGAGAVDRPELAEAMALWVKIKEKTGRSPSGKLGKKKIQAMTELELKDAIEKLKKRII